MNRLVVVALMFAAQLLGASHAGAVEATSQPCRADSWYWQGARPGVDAVKRVSKAGNPVRPAVVANYPVTRWTPVTGARCDRALANLNRS